MLSCTDIYPTAALLCMRGERTWMSKSSWTWGATSPPWLILSMSASAVLQRGEGAAVWTGSTANPLPVMPVPLPSPLPPKPAFRHCARQCSLTHPIIMILLPGLRIRSDTKLVSPAGLPPLAFSPSSFMRFSLTLVAASSLRLMPCSSGRAGRGSRSSSRGQFARAGGSGSRRLPAPQIPGPRAGPGRCGRGTHLD